MNYGEVIQNEISEKFSKSPQRKKLAEKCLEKGVEWIEVFSELRSNYGDGKRIFDLTDFDKKHIKKECTSYIKKNVDTKEEERIYGSVLLMIIMGAVVSWLVQRLLDEIFDEE
jgi:hypothetical protein